MTIAFVTFDLLLKPSLLVLPAMSARPYDALPLTPFPVGLALPTFPIRPLSMFLPLPPFK